MIIKLPNILKFLIVLSVFAFFANFTTTSHAVAGPTSTPTPSPTTAPDDITKGWVKDEEVTFVGKSATRAREFLRWSLSRENYGWDFRLYFLDPV